MSGQKWSTTEIQFVHDNIPTMTQEQVAHALGRSLDSLQSKIKSLRADGQLSADITRTRKGIHAQLPPTINKTFTTTCKRIAIIGDTQLTSRFQQLTHLKHFYNLCSDEGITEVYHLGDLADGDGYVYPGQIFELFIVGVDNHLNYIAENYPVIKGIKTRVIAGNHDDSYFKRAGFDFLSNLSITRPDIEYLGRYSAYINIAGTDVRMYMMHPSKAGAYALSYHPQKICEQFSSENKPQILALGHVHVGLMLPLYRNIIVLQAPCFQSQTPYLQAKGLWPMVGGIILDLAIEDNSIVMVKPEFRMYYKMIEKDY